MYGQKKSRSKKTESQPNPRQAQGSIGGLRQAHSPTEKIYIPMVVDRDRGLQTCLASFTPHLQVTDMWQIDRIIKNILFSVLYRYLLESGVCT